MNKFERNLKELQTEISAERILAEMLVKHGNVRPEKEIVLNIINACADISDAAKVAAYVFGQAGEHDMDTEVYAKRCEVLEYLKLVNYGLMQFFKNVEIPEVLEHGDQ